MQEKVNHSANVSCSCSNSSHSYAATGAAAASQGEKVRLTATQSSTQQYSKGPPGWKTVLPKRPRKPRRPRDEAHTPVGSHHPSSLPPNRRTPGQLRREKVSVPGARKIWGTMKACSVQTVSTTIAQLCPSVAGKLQLRRKFKTNDNGRIIRWWFLIRGEEDVLVELQQIWKRVSIQTSWRLEECLIYKDLPPEHPLEPSLAAAHLPIPTVEQSVNISTEATVEQSVNISTTEAEIPFLESQ